MFLFFPYKGELRMVEGAYVDDDRVRVAEAYALTPEMSARVAASTELLVLLPQYVWCDDGDTLEYIVSPLGFKYRVLSFTNDAEAQTEQPYIDLARHVLAHGHLRPDRTGVGTIGVFGAQMRFDISKSVPLLTTKRVPWKMCIEELLWFLRGDTDAKVLQRKGIKIWDGNTSREFLDARGLGHYEAGVLGPGYGWAMRHFGGAYDPSLADTSTLSDAQRASLGGADQVAYVLDQLRTDPFSRRILMCYWNPCDFDKIALLPCHFACQFYVDMDGNGVKHLSCHLNMRSNDLFLGNPCNLFGYAVLTYILAAKTGMRPKELVYTGGDVHIYANHVDQMNELFERDMRPLPMLVLDASVKNKDFSEMTIDDFDVVGYFPHPTIAAPMAV